MPLFLRLIFRRLVFEICAVRQDHWGVSILVQESPFHFTSATGFVCLVLVDRVVLSTTPKMLRVYYFYYII